MGIRIDIQFVVLWCYCRYVTFLFFVLKS